MEDGRKVVGKMKRNGNHGSIIANKSKIKGGKRDERIDKMKNIRQQRTVRRRGFEPVKERRKERKRVKAEYYCLVNFITRSSE